MICSRIKADLQGANQLVGDFVILFENPYELLCPQLRQVTGFTNSMLFLKACNVSTDTEFVTEALSLNEAYDKLRCFELEPGDEVYYKTLKAQVVKHNSAENTILIKMLATLSEECLVEISSVDLTPTLLLLSQEDFEE